MAEKQEFKGNKVIHIAPIKSKLMMLAAKEEKTLKDFIERELTEMGIRGESYKQLWQRACELESKLKQFTK